MYGDYKGINKYRGSRGWIADGMDRNTDDADRNTYDADGIADYADYMNGMDGNADCRLGN